MQELAQFATLAMNVGLLVAGSAVWYAARMLRGLEPVRKARQRSRDYYCENDVAIPVDELESRS